MHRFFYAFQALILLTFLLAAGASPAQASGARSLEGRGGDFCFGVFEIPLAQCEALVALYDATNGAGWAQDSGWLSTVTPCSWHGVTCAGADVVDLTLRNNNLVGTIPPEIQGLTELTNLSLEGNSLSGALPTSFGDLDSLLVVNLADNQLNGLGTGFTDLTSLAAANLAGNNLTSLPTNLEALSTLQIAQFDRNALSALPTALNGLTSLVSLNVTGNVLESLPEEICSIPSLAAADFAYNKILATPGTACLNSLDPDYELTQTVSPVITDAFADPERRFDDAIIEWMPIAYTGDGGGYNLCWSQTVDGDYADCRTIPDKSVSSFTAKGLRSGERYFFKIETFTDAHPLNPNSLLSGQTDAWPLGNSGLPNELDQGGPCEAYINQIVGGSALSPVYFLGVAGPLGHIIDSYSWYYTPVDDEGTATGPRLLLSNSSSLATNALPEGRYLIEFEATENPPVGTCTPDSQFLTIQPDRSFSDLEIRPMDVRLLRPDDPFENLVAKQVAFSEDLEIQITAHNLSAISERTEVQVEAWRGDPDDGGSLIGTVIIDELPPQGSEPVSIPWNVGTDQGFQAFVLRINYQANVDPDHPEYLDPQHPDYPPYPEVNSGNNEASAFVLVGPPVLGNFDIDVDFEFDLSSNVLLQHWAGVPYLLNGDAHYAFGNRLSVSGAEVEILVTDLSGQLVLAQEGRTIARHGSFSESVIIPNPGTYNVLVRVDDGSVSGEHQIQVTVIAPPPWPNLHFDQHPYNCHRNAITYEGPLVWREGCHYFTVQDARVDIRALLENTGFADATDYEVEVWLGAPESGTLLTTHDSADPTWPGTLPQGDSHNLTIPWPTMAAGNPEGFVPNEITSYNICLDAKLISPMDELTGIDNRVCRQLHVLKRAPDLRPANIRFGPWPVLDKDMLDITIDVVNRTPISIDEGCAAPPCSFRVTYFRGKPGASGTIELGSQNFTPSGSQLEQRGDVVTLPTFSWSPLSAAGANFGWQTIWVVVDSFDPDPDDEIVGEVEEAREGNNRGSRLVCVFKPDASFIRSHALVSTSYALKIGQPLTLTPIVRNKGELDHLVDVHVDLYQGHPDADGILLGSCTVPSPIAGRGVSKECSPGFPWAAPPTPGTIYIYARIQGTTETWARKLTILADPPPDLQIFSEDILLPAMAPSEGDIIQIRAEIRNVSELRDATNFIIVFGGDTPEGLLDFGTVAVPLLAANSSMVVDGPEVTIAHPYYAFLVELGSNPLEGDANLDDNSATSALIEVSADTQVVCHYPLDSTSWGPVLDAEENCNDGIANGGVRNLCGMPAWEDPGDPNLNTCLFGQFDGMDDNIDIPSTPELDFTDRFSVMAWAQPMPTTVLPQDGDIAGRGDRDGSGVLQEGFALGIRDRRWEFTVVTTNGTCTATSGLIPSPAEWDFVAATYDGTNIQLYVGDEAALGAPVTAGCTGNISWGSPGDDFEISPDQRPFRGLIDEVRLSGDVLDTSTLDGFRSEARVCDCDLIAPIAQNLRTLQEYQVDSSLPASDEPFHPLQRAINEALPGDTIAVRCGNREIPDTAVLKSGVRVLGGFSPSWLQIGCSTVIDGLARVGPCFEAIDVDAGAWLAELTLTSCANTGCGGGLYGENTALTLSDITWDGNTAGTGGGACFVNAEEAKILNSTLKNNNADTSGGGLYLSGGSLRLRDVNFEGNESLVDGGALSTDTAPYLSVTDTQFLDNVATSRGGAVFLDDDTVASFFNVLWFENEADRGAAISSDMFCGLLDVDNVTTYANVNASGAVIDLGDSCATSPDDTLAFLRNSILWNADTDEVSNSHWEYLYSNVEGGVIGTGILQDIPSFLTISGSLFLIGPASVNMGSGMATALGLGADQGYRTQVFSLHDEGYVDHGFHHQDGLALLPNRLAYFSLDSHTWRPTDEVRDLSGQHHHGKVLGPAMDDEADTMEGTSPATCEYGTFAGTSDSAVIRVPPCRTLEVSDDFTVAAWERLANTGSAMSILRHGDEPFGWELAYDGASWEATSFTGAVAETVSGTQAAVAGQWYHLAMVMDGDTLELYVNGVLDSSIAATGLAWDPLAPSDLRFADGGSFAGELDEVEIHDEALDLAAIQALASQVCSVMFSEGFEDGTFGDWDAVVQ